MATLQRVLEDQGFERDESGAWEYGFTGAVTESVVIGDGVEQWLFVDCLTGGTVSGSGARELETFLVGRGV